jgi:dCTP diphosphatase
VSDLDHLTQRMIAFTRARDWEQFHDPKSLISTMVGEVGERAELFRCFLRMRC